MIFARMVICCYLCGVSDQQVFYKHLYINAMNELQFFKMTSTKGVSDTELIPTKLPPLPEELSRAQGVKSTACLYFPDITPKSASRALRREIAGYPKLRAALEAVNWNPRKRSFTTLQQQLIVHYMGQP